MNQQPRYESDTTESEARFDRLTAGEAREFELNGSEQVDIFTGSPEVSELSDDSDDPRRFSVIDLRSAERTADGNIIYDGQVLTADTEYILIQPATLDWSAGKGYKGIRRGDVHDIGRKQATADTRFTHSQETSGNHFTVAVTEEGTLMIADNMSTNGTSLRTTEVSRESDSPVLTQESLQQMMSFEAPDPQPTLESLPAAVQDEVLHYRRAVYNKSEAEKEKKFSEAAEHGRYIYQVRQGLSSQAKEFLGLQ